MPIESRKPEEAFQRFQEHIGKLFTQTLPVPAHIRLRWLSKGGLRATLEFIRGNGVASCLPLDAEYGALFLAVRQNLEVERVDGKYRLKTIGYSYRLLDEDHPTADAAIRWEYQGDQSATHGHCRHHVQFPAKVTLKALESTDLVLDLNRSHTPTGFVTIEELIRFTIVELGTKPVGKNWPEILGESERRFYEDFTTQRYRRQGFLRLPGRGT
jgi:hypothetical protein